MCNLSPFSIIAPTKTSPSCVVCFLNWRLYVWRNRSTAAMSSVVVSRYSKTMFGIRAKEHRRPRLISP